MRTRPASLAGAVLLLGTTTAFAADANASGTLVEIEEARSLAAVPAAVRSALEARGDVLILERVTKGKTIAYEATVRHNGRKSEVAVDADGRPIQP